MNELRPLRVTSNQSVSRRLLESALEDHSAPGAVDRALQALQLGAATAVGAATAHAAASSGGASSVGTSIVLKWLGLGLLAGTLTTVAADRVLLAGSEPSARSVPAAREVERPARRAAVHFSEPVPAASVLISASSTAKAQRPGPLLHSRAVEPTDPAPGVSGAIADPLQELHAVRRALADNAPKRALILLDSFVTRHPSSTLLEEAAVLRFDALLSARSNEARAAGHSFLLRYPRSAYAERVRLKLSAAGDQSATDGH